MASSESYPMIPSSTGSTLAVRHTTGWGIYSVAGWLVGRPPGTTDCGTVPIKDANRPARDAMGWCVDGVIVAAGWQIEALSWRGCD